jgi:hypothetical protein
MREDEGTFYKIFFLAVSNRQKRRRVHAFCFTGPVGVCPEEK